MSTYKPVVLVVLDGWGHRTEAAGNAITPDTAPTFHQLRAAGPFTTLEASGEAVGLPPGQFGNSEVGHMTLGAGRVTLMELPRINRAVAAGELATNQALTAFKSELSTAGSTAHIAGLASNGGVHSQLDHIIAITREVASAGIPVRLHLFLDGRDTQPGSAAGFLTTLANELSEIPDASVATIAGRYYAMDRDRRWPRTERAWQAIACGQADVNYPDLREAIDAVAQLATSEELAPPMVLADYPGFTERDGMLLTNFRADRMRQLASALAEPTFAEFATDSAPHLNTLATISPLSPTLDQHFHVLFPAETVDTPIGQHLSQNGRSQLRVAESEKFPHVTYFFNGGVNEPCEGEDRFVAPSPKVDTYDQAPAMSAAAAGKRLDDAIRNQTHDFVLVNFANPDMVGHTGSFDAAQQAVAAVDHELRRLVGAISEVGGMALITADHGNAEIMVDPDTQRPHTTHTTSPVPVVMAGELPDSAAGLRAGGGLADVAPTVLDLMEIPPPAQMTGTTLLQRR